MILSYICKAHNSYHTSCNITIICTFSVLFLFWRGIRRWTFLLISRLMCKHLTCMYLQPVTSPCVLSRYSDNFFFAYIIRIITIWPLTQEWKRQGWNLVHSYIWRSIWISPPAAKKVKCGMIHDWDLMCPIGSSAISDNRHFCDEKARKDNAFEWWRLLPYRLVKEDTQRK